MTARVHPPESVTGPPKLHHAEPHYLTFLLTNTSTALVIGMPIHGYTAKLSRTLEALSENVEFIGLNHVLLIIANSDPGRPVSQIVKFPNLVELIVSSRTYWSGSVSSVYREFIAKGCRCPLLLMNHDCIPRSDCIRLLFQESFSHRLYAIHSQLNYLDNPERIWWCGSQVGLLGTTSAARSRIGSSNNSLQLSTSTMGQCLLIHPDLVDPRLLCQYLLPHYFSDSVQTTLMRRKGAVVAVLKTAIAFTDQSDYQQKLDRWFSGPALLFFSRCLLAPWSNRLISARIFSTYVEIDNKLYALLASFAVGIGTILVTLRDFIRLLLR